MQKTFLLLSIFSIFFIENVSSQELETFTTSEGNEYVRCQVSDIVTMFNMKTLDWENQMKKAGAFKGDYSDGGVTYQMLNDIGTNDGWLSITKSPDQLMVYFTLGTNKKSILDKLIYELEDYYTGKKRTIFNVHFQI